MIKYFGTAVVFEEIPDEVTLAIEITNCPGRCEGCHSPWLREDIGEELTIEALDKLIADNDGITCVCFMGEGNDLERLKFLSQMVRLKHHLKTALYSGREEVEEELYWSFNYVKIGPYKAEFGPLNKETTNQRLYVMGNPTDDGNHIEKKDITHKFWKRK